jgi:hypothetical protein
MRFTLTTSFALFMPALACGPDTDCTVADQTYPTITMLPDVEGPVGAFFPRLYRGPPTAQTTLVCATWRTDLAWRSSP